MSLRILDLDPHPVHEVPYRLALGQGRITEASLWVTLGRVAGLPAGLGGLVLTSDLQGRDEPGAAGAAPRLLGERVAEELQVLGELGVLPPAATLGVLLAGDLHADADLGGRGGAGDVSGVWAAFASRFRRVCGVAGNHDRFGDRPGVGPTFAPDARQHYLDGSSVDVDGLRVAGVSGIIGRVTKPFRREPEAFARAVRDAIRPSPHVLLLHEGPSIAEPRLRGSDVVRQALERGPSTLVVSGHSHWPDPLHALANGTQVCNVDARAVVLVPAGGSTGRG